MRSKEPRRPSSAPFTPSSSTTGLASRFRSVLPSAARSWENATRSLRSVPVIASSAFFQAASASCSALTSTTVPNTLDRALLMRDQQFCAMLFPVTARTAELTAPAKPTAATTSMLLAARVEGQPLSAGCTALLRPKPITALHVRLFGVSKRYFADLCSSCGAASVQRPTKSNPAPCGSNAPTVRLLTKAVLLRRKAVKKDACTCRR
jgi:hypothetical protein